MSVYVLWIELNGTGKTKQDSRFDFRTNAPYIECPCFAYGVRKQTKWQQMRTNRRIDPIIGNRFYWRKDLINEKWSEDSGVMSGWSECFDLQLCVWCVCVSHTVCGVCEWCVWCVRCVWCVCMSNLCFRSDIDAASQLMFYENGIQMKTKKLNTYKGIDWLRNQTD